MKDYLKKSLWLVIILTFALGACGASEEDESSEEDKVAHVYTAVAQTMEAQPTSTQAPATATLYEAPATITSFATQTTITQIQTQSSPTFAPAVQQAICQEALYMSDVTIPDGTIFTAGESFEKTWLILNAGTCAWESTYILVFVSGDEMSGVATVLGDTVSANGQTQVSVTFTAPLIAGTYTSYWKMTDGLGTSFGNTIFVSITVSDDATVTSTATSTSEYTATPTNTSVPTETSTPTTIPTDTSVPTDTPTP